MLPLDCVFFFFFFGSATGFVVMASGPTVEVVEVVVAGGSTVGWVSMAPSEWVLGQWVAGWVCCLGFFFFGVDGKLWVVAGGGSGGVVSRC